MHSSPGCPRRRSSPVSGSTTLTSTCGCTRPTVDDPPLEVVVGARLGRHRRGLGHAVADRDLGHVHVGRRTRFITSTGHGEPAMIPVRSVRQVEAREVGVRQLGDEHRRYAVQRRAPLGLHGRSVGAGSNPGAGMHDARAVGGRRQVAHHHPEAVVEGHRDADPVGLGVAAAASPTKKPLFKMLWWRERGALGKSGGAAVYWMLIGSSESAARRGRAARSVAARPRRSRAAVPLGRPRKIDPLRAGHVGCDLVDHRRRSRWS